MSDVSQGPGWWQASDGKWYSPEQATWSAPQYPAAPLPTGPDPTWAPSGSYPPSEPGTAGLPPASPYPPSGAGAYGQPPASPYPPSGAGAYGQPPASPYPMPGAPGYGYPPGVPAYGYAPGPKTNGLAIASLVSSFFFWLYGVGAILAIVFGFIARSQIKRSQGAQQGSGLALAGIIIGFVGIAIGIVGIILIVAVVHACNHSGTCSPTFTTN